MADLAQYQQSAASIYDPQLQAELEQLAQKKRSVLTALGEEEKTIEPEYQRALRGLGEQTRENEGKINQLYSQRLGGQFSGLQGNDMGMMFSKAADRRTDIETARAGKLSGIASRRTLAEQEEATGGNALRSRYTGLKNQYAQQAYERALREEEDRRRWEAQMAETRRANSARIASSRQSSAAPTIDDAAGLVDQLRRSGQYGDSGYGAIAQVLASRGYDIARGSLFDRALRKAYGFNWQD